MKIKTVIYADILIAVNMIVNYFLLRATAALSGADCKSIRMLISSAVGGIFSLIIFIESIPLSVNAIIKFVFMTVMIFIAFGAGTFKAFLKNSASFFIVNFAFAGIMLAVSGFIAPNKTIYKNGAVYFDINIITLTLASLCCYGILTFLSRLAKSRNSVQNYYRITAAYNEKNACTTAFYDTGNSLRDSFSGRPVIIADKSFAEKLIDNNFDITAQRNFRLIPYSTIKNGGALPAFLVDKIIIHMQSGDVTAEKIYVAVTEKKLISDGCGALLGAPVFEAVDNQIKGGFSAVRR